MSSIKSISILKVNHAYFENEYNEKKSVVILEGKKTEGIEEKIRKINLKNYESLKSIKVTLKSIKSEEIEDPKFTERRDSLANCLVCFCNSPDSVLMKCGHGGPFYYFYLLIFFF